MTESCSVRNKILYLAAKDSAGHSTHSFARRLATVSILSLDTASRGCYNASSREEIMQINQLIPETLLGKDFGRPGLQAVAEAIACAAPQNRAEIARRVCEKLGWRNAGGQPQVMSARVGLLRLHRLGLIELPPAQNRNGNGQGLTRQNSSGWEERPLDFSAHDLDGLHLSHVDNKSQSALWNGLMARYHYRGYTPLAGAQKRYLIEWKEGLLGAIGFGAAAWKLACRDHFIGWKRSVPRERYLHLILNNWRFLILPWVRCRNLASKVLAICARDLPADFERSYGFRPVLFESFVERGRFTGTCYRAANWLCVGQTQGRGKKDPQRTQCVPVKDVWLFPLAHDFRRVLGVTEWDGTFENILRC
jgi:hypothetical protein